MMLEIKVVIALIVLGAALVTGVLPILAAVQDLEKRWLCYGEHFAAGVFLGAGLIHLLPAAQSCFTAASSGSSYPWVFAIAAFSILLLRAIEGGVGCFFAKFSGCCTYHTGLAYLLAILLSIHSVLAGVALGAEVSIAGLIVICLAIMAHKGAAAFALGIKLRHSTLSRRSMLRLMFLFALMTPIGILCGSVLHHILQVHSGEMLQAIFNAIAAGTFIYIAVFEKIHLDQNDLSISQSMQLFYFAIGVLLMALIAIWI